MAVKNLARVAGLNPAAPALDEGVFELSAAIFVLLPDIRGATVFGCYGQAVL